MLWVPAASDAIVNVAAPFARAEVPSDVEPSSNVTFPAGVDPAAAVTVTLKVTLCPTVIWEAEAERAVEVEVAVVAPG
jgi:hypothetical protein